MTSKTRLELVNHLVEESLRRYGIGADQTPALGKSLARENAVVAKESEEHGDCLEQWRGQKNAKTRLRGSRC